MATQACPLLAITQSRFYTDGEEDKIGCFNTKDGELIWQFVLGPKFPGENGSFDGPISTPLIKKEYVYALSCQGRFVCVKLADGKLVWEKSLTEDFDSKKPLYGFATSPLAIGDLVVLMVGAKDKMTVAFDAKTGEEKWSGGNDSINSQIPAVVEVRAENRSCWPRVANC